MAYKETEGGVRRTDRKPLRHLVTSDSGLNKYN